MTQILKPTTFNMWTIILSLLIVITNADKNTIQKERFMWYAIRNGNLTTIKTLINDVPPNKMIKWQTPIALAAQRTLLYRQLDFFGFDNPYVTNLEYFIEMGADPCLVNGEGRTPYQHYMKNVLIYPNPRVKQLLDVCDSSNIHHYPDYQHCSKYYGNINMYSSCTKYPYAQGDFMSNFYILKQ